MENSYCNYCKDLPLDNVHRLYHDNQYGFPIHNDNALFGRLILEINQAGLSWETILKKTDNFYKSYDGFCIQKIANYNEQDRYRLLSYAGIIRNKLKVNATIHNANVIIGLQSKHGSFQNWINVNHPLSKEKWVKLFKKTFKFTGGEITNEFLMSSGYLPGAHAPQYPIHHKIIKLAPKFILS